jgi:enamine deaminase RidA (YjgF/YER057c/UK114 family)
MERIFSGSPWEKISGYARVAAGQSILCISATAATDDQGKVVCKGDIAGQTRVILKKMAGFLDQAGSDMTHVLQTRLYITDISRAAEACRAHAEVFSEAPPAMSLVHVLPFVDEDMLIEVELIAERVR